MNPVAVPVLVGPNPCPVTCPSCKTVIITKVDRTVDMRTHFMAFCLCVRACCPLYLCVPYCMNSCRNSDHYCPECDTYLGTYRR